MNILVTGGEGYIGSNLKDCFKREGWRFVSYDIVNLRDVRAKTVLEEYVRKADAVVHLAAISGVEPCQRNPIVASDTMIDGTYNVVELCKKYGIPVWFASSFASVQPVTLYGVLKRAGEILCESYANAYILRIANVYGGKRYLELKNSVIAKWTKAIRRREPITIYGNGEQKRDFIHVKDVCEGIIWHIKTWLRNPSGCPAYANLCTGKETSINRLARLFQKYAPKRVKPVKIVYARPDLPAYSPPTLPPSYPKNYKFVSLEMGLNELLKGCV